MQYCFFTFSALFPQPDMKIERVSCPGHHALHRTWGWLLESSRAKVISCQAAEGELKPVLQGQKGT